jgi:hypothetical protein
VDEAKITWDEMPSFILGGLRYVAKVRKRREGDRQRALKETTEGFVIDNRGVKHRRRKVTRKGKRVSKMLKKATVGSIIVALVLIGIACPAIADVWIEHPYVSLGIASSPEADWKGDRVERAPTPDGPWEAVNGLFPAADVVAGNVTDTVVQDGEKWYYRVYAEDDCGNRSAASPVSVAALINFEKPPLVGFQYRVNGCTGEVLITMEASTDPFFAEYILLRADSSGGLFNEVYRGALPTFTDTRDPGDVWYRLVQKDGCCFQSYPFTTQVTIVADTLPPAAPGAPIFVVTP